MDIQSQDNIVSHRHVLFLAQKLNLHDVKRATPRMPYIFSTQSNLYSLLIGKRGIIHIDETEGHFRQVLASEVVLLVPPQSRMNCSVSSPRGGGQFYEIVLGNGLSANYFQYLYQNFGSLFQLAFDSPNQKWIQYIEEWPHLDALTQSHRLFQMLMQLHQHGIRLNRQLKRVLNGERKRLSICAYQNRFSIQTIALALGCSTTFLDERFKELYGHTCRHILKHLRVKQACEHLANGKLTLAEIAYECGYANATSLSTAIKKCTGKSLDALRQSTDINHDLPALKLTLKGKRPTLPRHRNPKPTLVPTGPYFHFVGGLYEDSRPILYDLSISAYPLIHNWVLTTHGRARFIINSEEYELLPGRVLIHPHPVNAQIRMIPGSSWQRISIRTFGPLTFKAMEALTEGKHFFLKIDLKSKPVQLARKWIPDWDKARNEPSAKGSLQSYTWLLAWHELICKRKFEALNIPNLYNYISPTVYQNVSSIEDYAAKFGYSRSYFSGKLTRMWNNQPAHVLREQRLARAAQHLQDSRLSVGEIANKANYTHTSSFIEAFKKVYGVTPQQYRYRLAE